VKRSDLIRNLAGAVCDVVRDHPTRVAFDGVDAAGKTTLAGEVATALEDCGRQIIRASIDGFHNPRVVRRRDDSAEGYFRSSFNYAALIDSLLAPLGPNGSRMFRRAVFDLRADAEVVVEQEIAAPNAILLLDGVFLLRHELRGYWDLAIFVEADFATTVARAEVRDSKLFGNASAVRQRYESRYVPGQKLYLEQEQPKDCADFVVINNSFDNPRLERNTGRTIPG
jgi:uridine kinase